MADSFHIFTDVSLNPQNKIGIGGMLLLADTDFDRIVNEIDSADISKRIMIKRFVDTSSTQLEVETVLWALDEYRSHEKPGANLFLYTDSQCVCGLPGRRNNLEGKNFRNSRNEPLKHGNLYRKFYDYLDLFEFIITKIEGHSPMKSRDNLHRVFTVLDRMVRVELRKIQFK